MIPEWMVGAPRSFDTVLVANRGEIAVRVLRAARESGLRGIALFSDSDAGSLHVETADEAVHLPGASLAETYLNAEAIIEAARSSGAQAIHPGFGFLSERADLANDVKAAVLIWIGPPAGAIETMGDKISARRRMIESGVPVIPGEEIAISLDIAATDLAKVASINLRQTTELLIRMGSN